MTPTDKQMIRLACAAHGWRPDDCDVATIQDEDGHQWETVRHRPSGVLVSEIASGAFGRHRAVARARPARD